MIRRVSFCFSFFLILVWCVLAPLAPDDATDEDDDDDGAAIIFMSSLIIVVVVVVVSPFFFKQHYVVLVDQFHCKIEEDASNIIGIMIFVIGYGLVKSPG